MSLHNNSTSMQLARLSDLNNGRTMQWKSKVTANLLMLDSLAVSALDGGNSGDLMVHSLSMNKERYLTLMEVLMLRTETLEHTLSMEESTNNGM